MKARNDNYLSNRPSLSQYLQDAEENQRMNATKQAAFEESQKPLNKAASSKIAANTMKNIVEPGFDAAMLIEGGGLAKNVIKSGLKSMSKKAIADEVASTITSKGTTRYFDKAGKELPFTNSMRSIEEVKNYNQGLKNQFKTGATEAPPERLAPYISSNESNNLYDKLHKNIIVDKSNYTPSDINEIKNYTSDSSPYQHGTKWFDQKKVDEFDNIISKQKGGKFPLIRHFDDVPTFKNGLQENKLLQENGELSPNRPLSFSSHKGMPEFGKNRMLLNKPEEQSYLKTEGMGWRDSGEREIVLPSKLKYKVHKVVDNEYGGKDYHVNITNPQ